MIRATYSILRGADGLPLDRDAAITKVSKPDRQGHITRYSDSSFYDLVCVMCGHTDAGLELKRRCLAAPLNVKLTLKY